MKMRRLYDTCIRGDGAALVQWEEMKLGAPGICCYHHFAFSFDSGKFGCSYASYPLLITVALCFPNACVLSLLPFILACSCFVVTFAFVSHVHVCASSQFVHKALLLLSVYVT